MEERNMNRYDFDSSYAQRGLTLNQYVSRTFGWMFVGFKKFGRHFSIWRNIVTSPDLLNPIRQSCYVICVYIN